MTSNTPSNPPSSRPMTLRQQLEDQIWEALTENVDEPGLIGPSGEKQHANVKRLCQELAREARLDGAKKLAALLKEAARQSGSVNIEEGLAVFELTQKPPQPKENT